MDSRFQFWNDSSKVFATFDTLPKLQKQLDETTASLAQSRSPQNSEGKCKAPLKKIGTGVMLGRQITKFRRVLSRSRDGRTSEYELWVISDLPSQKNIFKLYSSLFHYAGDFGLPMKEYYMLVDGKRILRRRLLSEVVKVELVRSDVGKLLPDPTYRRVQDFFSVAVGEDGSELEMLFRNR